MFPLWLKLGYTIYVAIILGIYWYKYGPGNFLWFSDVAMIGAVPALWLGNTWITSVIAAAVMLPEIAWNASFFGRLLTGRRISGLTDYMFEPDRPRYLKFLSLFHVPLPLVLLWMVHKLGYEERALPWAVLLSWIVLALSYWLTPPQRNVNWVRGPGGEGVQQTWMPPLAWLALLMFGVFPPVCLVTHLLLVRLFA